MRCGVPPEDSPVKRGRERIRELSDVTRATERRSAQNLEEAGEDPRLEPSEGVWPPTP